MTEDEYILVTNKTALTCSLDSLGQVMCGKNYGVDRAKKVEAYNILSELRDELYEKIRVMNGE